MATLPNEIIAVFAVSVLLAFLVPYFKTGAGSNLRWGASLEDLKTLACVLAPFVVLFAVGQWLEIDAAGTLRYFAAAAVLPFILRRCGLTSRLTSLLLLTLAVLLTTALSPAGSEMAIAATVLGLVVWKLTDNLVFQKDSSLEDVVPALLWLSGIYWINTAGPEAEVAARQGLLLSSLSVAVLMRVVQGPFWPGDKWFLKRLVLSATGGLLLLICITKLLVVPAWELLAVIVGAGFLLAYLLDGMDIQREGGLNAVEAVKALVLVGIFTVLAGRLFGSLGWLALAPAMLVATRSATAYLAALYWGSRVLLGGYLLGYNPNVTGINITHAYAGAALYGGFLLALLLSLLLRQAQWPRLALAVDLALVTAAPMLSAYFIHAEATCSLLVAMLTAAVLLAVLAAAVYGTETRPHDNLMLAPFHMTAVAILSNKLIPLGVATEASTRFNVLAYLLAAVLAAGLIAWWFLGRPGGKPVEVAGD